MNSYGGYFLVRGGDKKCEEYKNWVKILSDSHRGAILARKNVKNGKISEWKNFVKMVKNR